MWEVSRPGMPPMRSSQNDVNPKLAETTLLRGKVNRDKK
jgi:hypothetical protein